MSDLKNEEQNKDLSDHPQAVDNFGDEAHQDFYDDHYDDHYDECVEEYHEIAWEIDAIEHEMEQMMLKQQETVDMSDISFQHNGTIYSIAIHPMNTRIIATGGGANSGTVFMLPENSLEKFHDEKKQDDLAQQEQTIPSDQSNNVVESNISSSSSSKINVIFQFQHSDPICCVAFSSDGSLLASASYDGHVKIWETETGVLKHDFCTSADFDWVRWNPGSDVVSAGSKDGNIWVWSTNTGQSIHVFDGHLGPVTCGIIPSKDILVTGSEDGTIRVWDIEEKKCKHVFSGAPFQNPITCIANHYNGKLIMTGSEDGIANILDISNLQIVATFSHNDTRISVNQSQTGEIPNYKMNNDSNSYSIETVGFCDFDDLCATGGMDGILKIWNFVSKSLLYSFVHPSGITKLEWHTTSPLIFTSSTDGNIRIWDASLGQLKTVFTGHQDIILDLKVVPIHLPQKQSLQNDEEKKEHIKNMIISGSDDETVKFFFY